MSEVGFEIKSSILLNKRVDVKPIIRNNSWLGKGHDGEFMYTGTFKGFCVPMDKNTGQLKHFLNKEEQKFFEKEMQLEEGALSFYDKNNEFWSRFVVKLDKNGITLDLNNVLDNLKWRMLLANNRKIAPSAETRFELPTYEFMIVDRDYEVEERVKKSSKIKEAYRAFGKLEVSETKMKDFLRVYGKRPSPNATREFLISEIDRIIEADTEGFLSITEDQNYELKLFIEDALDAKALIKSGKTGYALPGGDIIGTSQAAAITWLKDPRNSEEKLTIQAKVDKLKK